MVAVRCFVNAASAMTTCTTTAGGTRRDTTRRLLAGADLLKVFGELRMLLLEKHVLFQGKFVVVRLGRGGHLDWLRWKGTLWRDERYRIEV
jgi:hypothetical protein